MPVGIEEQPIARAEDLIDRLPVIVAYLEEMHAVAPPPMPARLIGRLATEMHIEDPLKLRYRSKIRVSDVRRIGLYEQSDDVT